MAVTRLWPVTHRLQTVLDYAKNPEKTVKENSRYSEMDYQALRDVLAYAKNEEKTEQEFFCEGINCDPKTAREEFVMVKEQFGKAGGIQAYHGYLSFQEQDITPECSQKIGMEFAEKVWGKRFQVVVTTHLNTRHLHCHFVINSVSFADGKRLHGEEKAWFKFHKVGDAICKKYGLHTIEEPERNPDSRYMIRQDHVGKPTPYNLARQAIDKAISISGNQAQFEYELKRMGYGFDFNSRHKYWTITPKGRTKPIRMYRLGEEYAMNRIRERLAENRNKVHFEPFQPASRPQKQYLMLLSAKDHTKKTGGLYGLYLRYCYELGVFSANQKQNQHRVHYLLREDLMKLDELTAQTTLLGKNQIETAEQLYNYQNLVKRRMQNLTDERNHLRNEIRKVHKTVEQLSEDKAKISEISDTLKKLRREIKLCHGIEERSGNIRERLDFVCAEEEKERKSYEQWR